MYCRFGRQPPKDPKGSLYQYRLKTSHYLEPNPSNVHSCVLKHDKDMSDLDHSNTSSQWNAEDFRQRNNTSYNL